MAAWYETWDWSRYDIGAGANVTQGFKHADWLQIRQEGEALIWKENALLQQMLYAPIVQSLSEVSSDISLKLTWNPAAMPKATAAHHIYWNTDDYNWNRDGALDVTNISVLDPNSAFGGYRGYTYGFGPRPGVPVGSGHMIASSTPVRPGKFYFEIEIIEDTYYAFGLAPAGWIEDYFDVGNPNDLKVAAIASMGRGTFAGLRAGAQAYDYNNINFPFYSDANTKPEHQSIPMEMQGYSQTLINNLSRPLIAGDILQFAYDSDNNRAFVGMNGIYARWNAAAVYTQMNPTNLDTGIVVDMKDKTYCVIAAPYRFSDLRDTNYVTNYMANANVRILTGNSCYYSPPSGYTDH